MAKRKDNPAKSRTEANASVEATIVHALQSNPDVRTVMDIAMRARALADLELPQEVDTMTEVRATQVSSQAAWQDPA